MFKSHRVVALSEDHGNEQIHALHLALIREPKFAATVNDIVVECGNALYQERMDRFVRGEDVPYSELREVWQNTTQVHAVWDRPIHEEFFRAVRAVNVALPKDRKLRVLLGDPPVDWRAVNSGNQQLGPLMLDRDRFPAELIQREVLDKGRRALVVYGGNHLFRAGQSLVKRLEETSGTQTFTIAVAIRTGFELLMELEPGARNWRAPTMAITKGTSHDAKQFVYYDAVLYIGPPSSLTYSQLSPALCADAAYVAMRVQRISPMPGHERELERFREECDMVRRK